MKTKIVKLGISAVVLAIAIGGIAEFFGKVIPEWQALSISILVTIALGLIINAMVPKIEYNSYVTCTSDNFNDEEDETEDETEDENEEDEEEKEGE